MVSGYSVCLDKFKCMTNVGLSVDIWNGGGNVEFGHKCCNKLQATGNRFELNDSKLSELMACYL